MTGYAASHPSLRQGPTTAKPPMPPPVHMCLIKLDIASLPQWACQLIAHFPSMRPGFNSWPQCIRHFSFPLIAGPSVDDSGTPPLFCATCTRTRASDFGIPRLNLNLPHSQNPLPNTLSPLPDAICNPLPLAASLLEPSPHGQLPTVRSFQIAFSHCTASPLCSAVNPHMGCMPRQVTPTSSRVRRCFARYHVADAQDMLVPEIALV